eukprot:1309-Rhodomonas_salina.1
MAAVRLFMEAVLSCMAAVQLFMEAVLSCMAAVQPFMEAVLSCMTAVQPFMGVAAADVHGGAQGGEGGLVRLKAQLEYAITYNRE